MHTTPIHQQSATAALGRTERTHSGGAAETVPGRGDQVHFSNAARTLAAKYASEGYDTERIAAIRARIENGSYNHPTFVQALAWRLIEAGLV